MKKKIIEVQTGYISNGRLGHVRFGVKFGASVLELPIVYIENPNSDNFRKARITIEELK